jgi:type IV pilus assembly protein PilZ
MAIGKARQGILNLTIKDRDSLFKAYMPFVKNGGLFIPTVSTYELGDEVFMLISLLDEAERIPVAGKVVWMTPIGSEGNRSVGVGVQFNEQDGGSARRKIEAHLGGMLKSEAATHTL